MGGVVLGGLMVRGVHGLNGGGDDATYRNFSGTTGEVRGERIRDDARAGPGRAVGAKSCPPRAPRSATTTNPVTSADGEGQRAGQIAYLAFWVERARARQCRAGRRRRDRRRGRRRRPLRGSFAIGAASSGRR
jgi:hypothetical protein